MRILRDRREIANEINIKRTTTVRIDLVDADDYGIKSQVVSIDNGTFKDGTPYLIKAEIRAFADEMKFTFNGFCTCLSDSFSYYDIEEMVEQANAPIIKPDSDVVLVIVNSRTKEMFAPVVLHTGKRINAHCMTPLTFIDEDNDAMPWMMSVDDANLKTEWFRRKRGQDNGAGND